MRFKIFCLLSVCLTLALSAQASQLTVTSTSGQLSGQITDPSAVTSLTVNGTIDVRDLEFIEQKLPALQTLNLENATITSLQNYRNLQSSQQTFSANELPSMIFTGSKISSIVLPKNLRTISPGALSNTNITSIVIPTTVTQIGAAAFQGCDKLKSITVPASVTTAGENMFDGCIALKSATWLAPDMPNRAFADCVSLTKVTLGDNVHSIGNEAFLGCTDLTTVDGFGTTFRSIGDRAFWGTGITEIDLSNSTWMSSIGEGAFGQCKNLEKAYFPEAVEQVGASAFLSDTSLTDLTGMQSIKTVPTAMLMNASAVTNSTVLGRHATEVEPYALYNDASISELYLPTNLASIGDEAFAGMDGLKEMKGSNMQQVPELGTDVWGDLNRPDITLVVNKDMADEFKSTPVWQDFAMNIGEPDGNGDIISLDPAQVVEPGLEVTMRGDILYIATAQENALGKVAVYDIDGRLLAVVNSHTNTAEFDTRRWPSTNIFIVNTALGNAKIARNF